ncbi:7-carboxy-7-deazaguanine synthase [uncultured archaeon]|nr:7-carboxy-7-deazaguanine synthase [uncultured archaeon]
MKIKKTKFDSYCLNGFAEGCRHCVKGDKLVLFVTGKCSRNCWYCSLSRKRKNKNETYANERTCRNAKEIIQEADESRATGAGITGGDPLLCTGRTVRLASALKKRFGKEFHIHIYLPTKLVAERKLKRIARVADEVRFHPEFLIKPDTTVEDLKKIEMASKFWKKENIGIELPMIPERKEEILDFIKGAEDYIGFVNLNEFELSETNFQAIVARYKLKEGGYVIAGSLESGKWILEELSKEKSKLKIHLCSAKLKNDYQYKNRLKKHKILPYGKRTEDGTVIYLIVNKKMKGEGVFYDEKKKRTILSEPIARKLLGKEKITRVEEFPTYDRIETESEEV